MVITIHTAQTINPARICQVSPLADGQARVVYVDAEGHYISGTVACRADALQALVDRFAEDALAAARSWA